MAAEKRKGLANRTAGRGAAAITGATEPTPIRPDAADAKAPTWDEQHTRWTFIVNREVRRQIEEYARREGLSNARVMDAALREFLERHA